MCRRGCSECIHRPPQSVHDTPSDQRRGASLSVADPVRVPHLLAAGPALERDHLPAGTVRRQLQVSTMLLSWLLLLLLL